MIKVPQEIFGKKSDKEEFHAENAEKKNNNRKDI